MEMSFLAIFAASLLGSPHCAGMCGGFVALYSCNAPKSTGAHLTYHLGRLGTYVLLGGLAGYAGSQIDSLGVIVGMQRISAVIVGVVLIMWGLFKLFPNTQQRFAAPKWLMQFGTPMRYIIGLRSTLQPAVFSLLVGASSTFLPCGWLYMFAAVAAASGSWLHGMATMVFFWLGTVPILAGLAILTQFVSSSTMRYTPRITAALVILAGLFSLSGHLNILPASMHNHSHHHSQP